jgi:hypothetical protein
MAPVEAALKFPSIPLFSKGEVSLTPLGKRAEGEIFGRNEGGIMSRISGAGHSIKKTKEKKQNLS